MEAKFLRQKGNVSYYELSGPGALNDELLDSLDWPKDAKGLVFDFPPFGPPAGYLDPPVSEKYTVAISYQARRGEIEVPADFKAAPGLAFGPAGDPEEFRKLAERGQSEYLEPIRQYLNPAYLEMCRDFVAGYLDKCDNRVLTLDGRAVGLVAAAKTGFKGEPGLLLAEFWIDSALPEETRESAKFLIAKWLKEQPLDLVVTGEHAKSVRTQKFFTSLGFKAARFSAELRG